MGFSTRHTRGRPSAPSVAYPGGAWHDKNPICACACRQSWQWPQAHVTTLEASSHRTSGRSRRHALVRNPVRKGEPSVRRCACDCRPI
eukprot:3727533-Pleurochrysis_carterae.AAC.4